MQPRESVLSNACCGQVT